jgi:hypothetical protein
MNVICCCTVEIWKETSRNPSSNHALTYWRPSLCLSERRSSSCSTVNFLVSPERRALAFNIDRFSILSSLISGSDTSFLGPFWRNRNVSRLWPILLLLTYNDVPAPIQRRTMDLIVSLIPREVYVPIVINMIVQLGLRAIVVLSSTWSRRSSSDSLGKRVKSFL